MQNPSDALRIGPLSRATASRGIFGTERFFKYFERLQKFPRIKGERQVGDWPTAVDGSRLRQTRLEGRVVIAGERHRLFLGWILKLKHMARRINKKAKHGCRQCGNTLPLSVMMDGHKLICSECGLETNLLEALSRIAAGPTRLHKKKNSVAVKAQPKNVKRANYGQGDRSAANQNRLANLCRP